MSQLLLQEYLVLEDGLKLIAERGKLMQALPQTGEMVAIFASKKPSRKRSRLGKIKYRSLRLIVLKVLLYLEKKLP